MSEPLTLTLPWAVLAHDNHRFIPRHGGKGLIAAPAYREAKRQTATLLALYWCGPTYSRPVELTARAFVPDARKRDVGNYRKLITDALTGIAYTDDSLVHREVWERAGIDRANPRIELTIRLLIPCAQ
jgi:Holliday junction resolvase RusA-like endonuclease